MSRGLKRGHKGAKGQGQGDDFEPRSRQEARGQHPGEHEGAFGAGEAHRRRRRVADEPNGAIDWDNAPEELLKGLLQEYNEVGTERGVQTAQAGRRARKHDRHMAANSQYLNTQEKADFERMNGTASDTDPFVTAQDYARIRTEVAVAGLAGWESKNGPLAPAQRDAFIRHVREATTAEELSLRAKKDPLSIAEVRQAAVAGQHVQVGKPVPESVARQVIRDLADGKVASLAQLASSRRPASIDKERVGPGAAHRPADRRPGVHPHQGDSGAVDWADFRTWSRWATRTRTARPTSQEGRSGRRRGGRRHHRHRGPRPGSLPAVGRGHGVRVPPRDPRAHRVHAVPVARQRRVGKRVPGSDNPGVDIVIRNPVQVGMLWGNPDRPVVRAEIEVRAGGQLLWSGPIYGADHPSLGSVISDRPAEWMVGADTGSPTAGTATAAPTGATTTSGSREAPGSAGTGVIQPPVAPSERTTVVGPAVASATGARSRDRDPRSGSRRGSLRAEQQPSVSGGMTLMCSGCRSLRPTGRSLHTDPSMRRPAADCRTGAIGPRPRGVRGPIGGGRAVESTATPIRCSRTSELLRLPRRCRPSDVRAHHRSRAECTAAAVGRRLPCIPRAHRVPTSPVSRGFLFKARRATSFLRSSGWPERSR